MSREPFQTRDRTLGIPVGLIVAALLATVAGGVFADDSVSSRAPREPVAETPTFAFYNEFWPNAHDALVRAATDRSRQRSGRFATGKPAECFSALAKEEQAAWNAAVGFYAETVVPTSAFSNERLSFRYHFIGKTFEPRRGSTKILDPGLPILEAGSLAYRACLWKEDQERNRAWIEELVGRLRGHEEELGQRLAAAHQVDWRELPITVDVIDYVSWSGANTVAFPWPHIQISSSNAGYQDLTALEMIFHEASHLLIARPDAPIKVALAKASEVTEFELPGSLWHGVLFHTSGWITEQILNRGDSAGYVQYAVRHGVFSSFHDALASAWTPNLRGEIDLDEAAVKLLQDLQ